MPDEKQSCDAGPQPGTVWWCDGAALSFEAYFKRRPALVLALLDDGMLLVAPLSSKRRFGQEQIVTHDGGISFLTGAACVVAPDALLSPLGEWEGFAAWRAAQEPPPPPRPKGSALRDRLRRWFRRA